VLRVFPNIESYLRPVTAYLIEYTEDWANENAYIKSDKLRPLIEQGLAQVVNQEPRMECLRWPYCKSNLITNIILNKYKIIFMGD